MDNIGIANVPVQFLQHFMHEHPFRLTVLIGQNEEDEYEVLYANTLALDFFSGELHMPVTRFFGDVWLNIVKQITGLNSHSTNTVEFDITRGGETVLFKVDIHKNEDHEQGGILLIELRERQDIASERVLRAQLQHKYTSVIDHNLDPIISIDLNWKVITANQAVHAAYGYRMKELTGNSILNLVEEKNVEKLRLFIKRGFAGECIELEGISFFHKKGEYLPAHLKILPVVVEGEISEIHLIIRDVSKNHENHEKLQYLSNHDQLTGLWNRKSLNENFMKAHNSIKNKHEKFSVIHTGLDRFKLLIEALGQNGADEILKKVAERMKSICPNTGKLYRNGGDEFIVTLPSDSIEKSEEIAQKILNEFGKPFYYNHQEYFISASIGISTFPKDGKTVEELLRRSGQALLYVKENGRSHYRFYEKEMNSIFPDEVLMESHLRRAIELNELQVYYQPQVELRTGNISSFEALLRWNNKKFGFVSPGQFIPIAEKSGLIHSIGDWVLNSVCSQLKRWQDKRYRPVRIAVNISPQQFHTGNFANEMRNKIEEYDIMPSSLEVEITESALTRMHETLATLNALKKIGVYVSVDDFGTGYSSLSYLKKYPIDIIKIDRSFIQDIESDKKNAAIAKTIINLAHNLGMEVIAEGVEKDLQAEILLEAKCQKAQGFLYSKAIPVEEIINKYFEKII